MYNKKCGWILLHPHSAIGFNTNYRLIEARSGCAAGLVLSTLRLLLEADVPNILSRSSSTGRFVDES